MVSLARLRGAGGWSLWPIIALLTAVSACSHTPARYTGTHKAPATYTVHKGDSLYTIAMRYRLNYRAVASWNGIRSPYTIYPGQRLKLRPPAGSTRGRTTGRSTSRAPAQTAPKASSTKTATRSRPAAPAKAAVSLSWRWPTRGKVVGHYSTAANGRKGIDIAGRSGQPVVAAAAGTVVYSGSGLRGYGRLIIIKHNENYLSAYAHNRKLFVHEGEGVAAGQKIAELGSSGADRPKLHFEIRHNGRPVDPLQYLP